MRWQWKRWSVSAVVLLAAVLAVAWPVRIHRQQAARLAQLAAENNQLRQRVAALSRVAEPPAAAPAARPAVEGQCQPCTTKPQADPEDAIAIQRLTLNLAEANASMARLQSHSDQADAQIQSLSSDNQRLAASEADLKENLATVNQSMEALQKELNSSRDREAQVETAYHQAQAGYQKLRDQSGGDTRKLTQIQQLAAELQDIHRRREVYLNSILRRYRQITDQYRSLSGVLQAQRTDAPAVGSADLARIQDSIAMAEEDLRQLNNLNAQALLVQKKMAGK